MNVKEAIDNVESCVHFAMSEYNTRPEEDAYDEESLAIAIKAMMKQEPIKPEKNYGENYYCPKCGDFVGSSDCVDGEGVRTHYRKNYCEECGQAIDWEVKND